MTKIITHKKWIEALEKLYRECNGEIGYENDSKFEAWLRKTSVEDLLKLIEKMEKE